ncbi:ComGF family competence protein [Companilactobacillus sp. HBUAS56275]|uniref:ComGF family competence protein n=1 Tax=Candidatus Companilactobacillus pullicola TaxID=2838523 RepID=A0A9D2CN16_9LACO|nr:ComGF family competence protein [Candidatus Companilactobacillus pullicola]
MSIKSKVKRKGFVLYESILALMITLMTLGILQQSLLIMRTVQHTTFKDQLRWHVTQEKLQSELDHALKIDEITNKHIIYTKPEWLGKSHPAFVFDIFGNEGNKMLRYKTAVAGGHEPILMNQKEIKIEKGSNLVIITTVNKAGEKSEMYLTLDERKI